MNDDVKQALQSLLSPKSDSHKGQNGRLLLIGGSKLFHAASLWSLTVASRIVDLVHYCSIPENNEIVEKAKEEFRNGIVIHRAEVEEYIKEDDVILIGPGMTRDSETEMLTTRLLKKYPEKQWVIDAGALQMANPILIPKNAIVTPHKGEFDMLLKKLGIDEMSEPNKTVHTVAMRLGCIVLLKGPVDVASNGKEVVEIEGGNAGMTKGGTGDVLAGLIAALSCTNDAWVSTVAGSYINKKAGDTLHEVVGPYFNASDLADQIPRVMGNLLKSRIE